MQAGSNEKDIPKKRILITGSTFPRYAGDTEPRFILDLAKSLKEYYDVTVLVPADPEASMKEMIEGVKVERYHYFPIHKLETLCYPGAIVPRIKEKKIRILLVPFLFLGLHRAIRIRKSQYDVVHANWLIPQGIVQSYFKMPYLLTGHGGDIASLNIGPLKALKRRAIRNAGAVTTVSRALKEKAVSLFPEKEQAEIAEKIVVQPFGCDTTKFGRQFRVENLWGQGNRKVVLFVGRLAEKKGVRYLIEAMQKIDARLVIAGDGPLRPELEARVQELSLQEKISFIGARNHAELPEIYASADIFAAPSITAQNKDTEGFPLVIFEAMASGLPVVVSKSGGIAEIIRHEYNGMLTEEKNVGQIAECINRLLADASLREQILANETETVKQYDYQVVGGTYAELIGICDRSGVSG